ncbi:GroES-like protein [Penicillium argentinense]|uniref:GroES-like protein n=1 Tax=Penicillium argentinense TaxID=1131581 RepID=A0A9W9G0C0_9EURO|nr:GroES-like protein [Penicillium argentinense]KAJ5109692.1 GroES-like protein [Penicillium argentinense]
MTRTLSSEGSSEGSKKLMRDIWWDGTFAEYAKVPLVNCIPLDEARLDKEMGYSLQDLAYMAFPLVPYGFYGSLGVQVATAMGARVIALGRNSEPGEVERGSEEQVVRSENRDGSDYSAEYDADRGGDVYAHAKRDYGVASG